MLTPDSYANNGQAINKQMISFSVGAELFFQMSSQYYLCELSCQE